MPAFHPGKTAPLGPDAIAPRETEGILRQIGALFRAIIRQRCPRCREGAMFRGRFEMNEPCPVCGLLFQREEGYFLGAMYVSFPLATAIIVPFFYLLGWLLPRWSDVTVGLLATLLYVPFMPAVFRYSRVLWIYFERGASPSDASASAYEKARLQQIAHERAAPSGSNPPDPLT